MCTHTTVRVHAMSLLTQCAQCIVCSCVLGGVLYGVHTLLPAAASVAVGTYSCLRGSSLNCTFHTAINRVTTVLQQQSLR